MINRFDKEYLFLSNFSNNPVRHGNFIYPTSEHAFQAAKTWNAIERMAILSAPTPGIAKNLEEKCN